MPACRWCDRPVRLVECDGRWEWIHTAGGFPCRDAESWALLDTAAEPSGPVRPGDQGSVR